MDSGHGKTNVAMPQLQQMCHCLISTIGAIKNYLVTFQYGWQVKRDYVASTCRISLHFIQHVLVELMRVVANNGKRSLATQLSKQPRVISRLFCLEIATRMNRGIVAFFKKHPLQNLQFARGNTQIQITGKDADL